MNRVLCSRPFHIFHNMSLNYSSLYTRLQIILKLLYPKVIHQVSIKGRGIFEIVKTNQKEHKNVQ